MNPLLFGPALVLRALDDLHAIAEAARDSPRQIERLEARLEGIEAQVEKALGVAQEIESTATTVVTLGERMLEEAQIMAMRAEAVAQVGTQVVAALPTLERAVMMATPLEGAVERVGRLVDRLPGYRPPER